MTRKTIKVEYLSRVEGEGALHIKINDETVEDVRLEIFEPPRFFEAFLQGRHFTETPDIVARICGICPVAYQMSAVHALENALGITVTGPLRDLRRLLYCGEWIESHVLHIYMLHAPDFLNYPGAIEMAKDHREVVERGLKMKKAGNELLSVLGGRAIHPINVKVGGFFKVVSSSDLKRLLSSLQWARDAAIETVRWAATLPFPSFERDYECIAMQHQSEYPMNEGVIVSSSGMNIEASCYEAHFEEHHVPHSTALHSSLRDASAYLVGPMSRFNLNYQFLSPLTRALAREVDLQAPCLNPFKSIIVRSLEVLHAFDEAIELIESYEPPSRASVDLTIRAGIGFACTEAPRGLLFHRYEIDDSGKILSARIVPPTSQNQGMIEKDLKELVQQNLHLSDEMLQARCEQAIRNYDPCISCATHFLNLVVQRI